MSWSDFPILMFVMGGKTLSDLRERECEKGLRDPDGLEKIPNEETRGDWLRRRRNPKNGQKGLKVLRDCARRPTASTGR